jgi:uncharacterized protein (TIGR03437 family)
MVLTPAAGRAQTLFNTFGPGETFLAAEPGASVGAGVLGGFPVADGGISIGYAFTPTATANLSRVDLGMSYTYDPMKASGPADLDITVASDEGGQPGATIETIQLTGVLGSIPSAPGIVSAYSVTQPLLHEGVQYWLLVAPPDLRNTTFDWRISPQQGLKVPMTSKLAGPYWETANLNTALAYAVFGTQNSGARASVAAGGLVDAASFRAAISAGSWMTIFGSNLSSTTRSWQAADFVGNTLPITLDGVSVQVNGYPAAVSYISPGQINAQVPDGVGTGTATVQVITPAGGSALGQVAAQAYAPGFFTFGSGGAVFVAATNADGTVVGPNQPAHPGDMVSLYASGFGPTTPGVASGQMFSGAAPLTEASELTVTIGNIAATVQFAGMSAAGLYQFNLAVPNLPDGNQPVVAQIQGFATQTPVNLTVQNQ